MHLSANLGGWCKGGFCKTKEKVKGGVKQADFQAIFVVVRVFVFTLFDFLLLPSFTEIHSRLLLT
jgi:hypothetical protein